MKAIVHDRYGTPEVLEHREVDKPAVGDDEVLVRVIAASVNSYDWHTMTGLPRLSRLQMGLSKPKHRILGADLAGRVEAVGEGVSEFQIGDEVFGESIRGTCAEYAAVPEDALASKPANLTFEQAAAVPLAATTALQGLRDRGRIQAGQQVLINGASGGVGLFAVQIAKSFGAEVTGVCSTKNLDLVGSMGADHVVDYTREDFSTAEPRYDLMLDNVGNRSLTECRRVLKRNGVYVASFGRPHRRWVGPLPYMLKMLLLSPFVSHKLVVWVAEPKKQDLLTLKELLEAGKIIPFVEKAYPLIEAREAMQYLAGGHVRGKLVITT